MDMLNALASELNGLLLLLERIHIVEHFTLSIIATRIPIPTTAVEELSPLLSAIEECQARLNDIFCDRPLRQTILPHYGQSDGLDSHQTVQQARQDWRCSPSGSNINDYRLDVPPKCEIKDESFAANVVNLGHYSNAPSPECLEALNLSVAASPECLAAINLSLAPSPCYNPSEEVPSAKDSLKTLNDGASTFWDKVALDVVNTFDGGNLPGPISAHPLEANLEFTQDIDSTSVLGDGYMLDISSNVNFSVTDALNASLYFEMHRDPPDIVPCSKFGAEIDDVESFQVSSAALDLSHQPPLVHYESITNQSERKNFQCLTCGKEVNSRNSLRRHEEAHKEGSKICDFCGKAFHSSWLLRRHVLAHVSNHVCQMCGKRCVNERKLRRHMAIHSAGTHHCYICRQCFTRADGLKRHMDITHAKNKQFMCDLCNHSFSMKCNLDSHIDSVHGGCGVQCHTCGKKFKNKGSLRAHSRLHKEPIRACDICKQSFHRLFHYHRHMRNKHGET